MMQRKKNILMGQVMAQETLSISWASIHTVHHPVGGVQSSFFCDGMTGVLRKKINTKPPHITFVNDSTNGVVTHYN
jgi:hypothetical protein